MPRTTVNILINGQAHVVSDCAQFRLQQDGTSCAKGFDLATNPCSTCTSYEARPDDPMRNSRITREPVHLSKFSFTTAPPPPLEPKPVKQGIIAKATSWLRAEASAIVSSLPDGAYEKRVAACRACPHLDPLPEPQVGYCKACGCGKRARSELTVKGRMPAATCPKKKWES
jgi:hypothetical protein